jgi:hypothetical protein
MSCAACAAAIQQQGNAMRALISGIVVAVVLGVVAALVLRTAQETAYVAYSTSSTRLGNPGDNLVGKSWTGNPRVQPDES